MNSCLKLRATQEEQDVAREEWFAMRLERQRQREQKAKVAAAQEDFMREWWGLPEDVRLSRQRELEKKEERIGGMPAKNRPRTEGGR
jgi:COX assembly protein 1